MIKNLDRGTVSSLVKIIFPTLAGIILSTGLLAQDVDSIQYHRIAGGSVNDSIFFCVSLPESYSHSSGAYPVVYYLHGMDDYYGGILAQWMADFLNEQARNNKIPEVIAVFPDGKEGFWGNHYGGDPALEIELIDELIPHINQNFSTDKHNRIIMGFSAGGFGALYFYMKYPELFNGVVSLDGSVLTWEEALYFESERINKMTNSDSVYYYEHATPYPWVARNRKSLIRKPAPSIFIAASLFIPYHQRFLSLLENQNVAVNYIELDCNHDFSCVMSGVSQELIDFISQILGTSKKGLDQN